VTRTGLCAGRPNRQELSTRRVRRDAPPLNQVPCSRHGYVDKRSLLPGIVAGEGQGGDEVAVLKRGEMSYNEAREADDQCMDDADCGVHGRCGD
jgi:hypothetical protein